MNTLALLFYAFLLTPNIVEAGLSTCAALKPLKTCNLPVSGPLSKYLRSDGKTVVATNASGKVDLFLIGDECEVTKLENQLMPETMLGPCGRFVVSPMHKDGSTKYFRVSNIKQSGSKAKPVFSDTEHDGFYGSMAGECHDDKTVIKNLTWNSLKQKQIIIGKDGNVKEGQVQILCHNLFDKEGKKKLESVLPIPYKKYQKIMAAAYNEAKRVPINGKLLYDLQKWFGKKENAERFDMSPTEFADLENIQSRLSDIDLAHGIAQPVISLDGKYLLGRTNSMTWSAGLTVQGIQINPDGTCSKDIDTHGDGEKGVFGRSSSKGNKTRFLAYEKEGKKGETIIYLVDVEKAETTELHFNSDKLYTYPAMTKKGEIAVTSEDGKMHFFDIQSLASSQEGCYSVETEGKAKPSTTETDNL